MTTIGFVGLGHMGQPMAENLVKAGHDLVVFDLAEAPVKALVSQGAKSASSVAELAGQVDVAITMLQTGDQVKSVCFGDDSLFNHLKKGSMYLDCSTIDVESSRQVHKRASELGFDMLDAPVSGGVLGAQAATLTFMVGGDKKIFEDAKPLFEAMGKNIIHAGQAGNGQVAKICNNMILGASMIAVSEGFLLGESLGLDAKTLFDISSTASAQCWSMTTYCPAPGVLPNVPSSNSYKAGFSGNMMLKDMHLSQTAADHAGAATPLSKAATRMYEEYVENGGGDLDFSGIYQMLDSEK
ncbi:MAG: 3-hydroxyisobutyrate dehydrogenase [Coxiellaceae bacterium]|nr:3-hydroxyisobutyrate dehydrogenase [Coxiellaceae bacterium]